MGFAAGDPNLYRRTAGDPVDYTDPSGMSLWSSIYDTASWAADKTSRWVYTGDSNASDDVYQAATEAGGAYVMPRIGSAVKTVNGVMETTAGAGMMATGVAAAPGAVLMAHGVDTTAAGLQGLYDGQDHDTLTARGVTKVTGSKTAGNVVDMAVPLAAGGVGYVMTKRAAAAGAEVATAEAVESAAAAEAEVAVPRVGAHGAGRLAAFRTEADLLKAKLGPARLSHPEEFAGTLRQLEEAGVEVEYRAGTLAYAPERGGPGKMILDPDASLGALRHEFKHFADVRDAGYPGFGRYMADPQEFARMEVRAYMEEVKLARELGHLDVVPNILQQMKDRVRQILGK